MNFLKILFYLRENKDFLKSVLAYERNLLHLFPGVFMYTVNSADSFDKHKQCASGGLHKWLRSSRETQTW